MKLVYTQANPILVNHAFNLLSEAGFDVVLRNQFIGAGAGDLSPFDTWLELWVRDDRDLTAAKQRLDDALADVDGEDRACKCCNESNPSSFERCWHCGSPVD